MNEQWMIETINEWNTKAKNYPTKALLYNLSILYQQQLQRIEMNQGMLDGGSWSRQDWQQERQTQVSLEKEDK